jgi:hypothetical protein
MTDTVTITRKEYNQLLEDAKILERLYANGVDNWEGWDGIGDESEEDIYGDEE